MKNQDTLKLVQKAMRGNRHAFSQLLEKKIKEIVFLCSRELHSYQDGEDAAQEVCIQLQRGITNLRSADAFNVWLNRVIYTTCVKMKRDGMKMQKDIPISEFNNGEPADELAFSASFMEVEENRRLVGELVDALPDEYRRYVLLHYYQGLKYSEIANITGVSVHTVANGLRAARLVLKKQLSDALGHNTQHFSVSGIVPGGVLLGTCLSEYAQNAISSNMALRVLKASGTRIASKLAMAKGVAAAGISVAVVTAGITAALQLSNPVYNAGPATPPPIVSETSTPEEAVVEFSGSITLQNTALDASASNQLAGATVLLENENGEVVANAQTSQDGTFALTSQKPGSYRVRLELPTGTNVVGGSNSLDEQGHLVVSGQSLFTAGPGQTLQHQSLQLLLAIPASVTGTLNISQQQHMLDISQLEIDLLDPDGKHIARTQVQPDGQYQFENPMINRQGEYTLRLHYPAGNAPDQLELQEVAIHLYPGYGATQ